MSSMSHNHRSVLARVGLGYDIRIAYSRPIAYSIVFTCRLPLPGRVCSPATRRLLAQGRPTLYTGQVGQQQGEYKHPPPPLQHAPRPHIDLQTHIFRPIINILLYSIFRVTHDSTVSPKGRYTSNTYISLSATASYQYLPFSDYKDVHRLICIVLCL